MLHTGVVVTRYINKTAPILLVPAAQLTVVQRNDLMSVKTSLESKGSLIADLGKEIELLLTTDEDLEAEVQDSSYNLETITGSILQSTRKLTQAEDQMAHPIQPPQATHDERQQHQRFKLPKLNIPIFTGEYLEWNSFWDLFNATVHSIKKLTDGQRLQYLEASLKGDAAKVITYLKITNANYAGARNALQARYANLHLIVRSHIKAKLDVSVIKNETAREMRLLLDTFREQIQALKSLGLPVNHWDTLLVYHISEKLDTESWKAWELEHAGNELQTVGQMLDFCLSDVERLNPVPQSFLVCSPQTQKRATVEMVLQIKNEGLGSVSQKQTGVKLMLQTPQRQIRVTYAKAIIRCKITRSSHLWM